MSKKTTTIEYASKLLGRKLCGRVPHVVGTSLLVANDSSDLSSLNLFVDVDTEDVAMLKYILPHIPSVWRGHKVYIRISGTPAFAGE